MLRLRDNIYIYSAVSFDFPYIGLNIDIPMKYMYRVSHAICSAKISITLNMICLCKFVLESYNKTIVVFKSSFNMMF